MQRVITQYSSSTIPICLPSGGLVGGLPSEGIHTEDLLSRARATDFGFGILPTRSGGLRSGGLHSGGLLSKATDFGSGILPTRSEGLRSGDLYSRILLGLLSRATDFGSGFLHACP